MFALRASRRSPPLQTPLNLSWILPARLSCSPATLWAMASSSCRVILAARICTSSTSSLAFAVIKMSPSRLSMLLRRTATSSFASASIQSFTSALASSAQMSWHGSWTSRALAVALGLWGAPPCSTWSKARHKEIPNGPRPLRSRENPLECLPGRSPQERRSCEVGTGLFLLTIWLLGCVASSGGWVGFEHPKGHRPPYPSIFATAELLELQAYMSGRYISFHQCLFGAVSVKPTGFLTNDSAMFQVLCGVNGGCCNHVARHTASIGRSLAGGLKTTPLAAYPPALCMALAGAVVTAFAAGRRRGHDQPFAPVDRPWTPIL